MRPDRKWEKKFHVLKGNIISFFLNVSIFILSNVLV